MAAKSGGGLCFLKSSAKAEAAPKERSIKCVTCAAFFPDVADQKSHFKSEWHLYNVKRKDSGIDAMGHAEFLQLKERLVQMMELKNNELENKSKAKMLRRLKDASPVAKYRNQESSEGCEETCDASTVKSGVTSVPYCPTTCLFSGKKSATVEENLQWMAKTYSFFLPEQEHLVDVNSLLTYLHDKIYNKYTCLCCHRIFKSIYAVMHHMDQKQHRKVNDDDFLELAQFYDFTNTYADLIPSKAADESSCGSTADDDDDDWEDVITGTTDSNEAIQRLAYFGVVRAKITDCGNLALPNGREAVHRDVSYVYKQNLVVRSSYGISKSPAGFQFLRVSEKRQITRAEKQKRTRLDHVRLKMQYKSYKLFVPCNQIAYAT
ncbi:hypothetical protein, conserved [Babesia bigemina]|uniref:C2H2-type domain-containing protein n=1 Tax=Babesia bigemina TaxID=5866 RepID=A0A061CZM6_BABBI|nr:hypothetical protein, conserved [Babesia bigemina]CDR93853.1 hypothetical protein, conserved [Babesia bigemina]|eukprot:XP_012766039.1 hypothetical protein, conserved [Babesia bigemina]